jgi:hypothetical protein
MSHRVRFASFERAFGLLSSFANSTATARSLSRTISERREKALTTLFQVKTFTAIGPLEQAFHFLGSRNQIVHFGYLALRQYLPAVERRNPLAESVEELPNLIDAESRPLRHIDDGQVVEDTGFVPALPADALGIW